MRAGVRRLVVVLSAMYLLVLVFVAMNYAAAEQDKFTALTYGLYGKAAFEGKLWAEAREIFDSALWGAVTVGVALYVLACGIYFVVRWVARGFLRPA